MDFKFVTLKDFPFAKANQVCSPDGFLQFGDNLSFSAGAYKYNLKKGVDYREYDPTKDASLTVASLPSARSSLGQQIGSTALLGFVIYKGYKQHKGAGFYIGYGLLALIAGSIAGSMLGKALLMKEYNPSTDSSKAMGNASPTSSGDLASAIDNSAVGIVKMMSRTGINKSASEVKSALTDMSKNYTSIQKDYLAGMLNMMSKLADLPQKSTNPDDAKKSFAALADFQNTLKAKGYSDNDIQTVAVQINSDFEKIEKNFLSNK
jgi:hypothetical protein